MLLSYFKLMFLKQKQTAWGVLLFLIKKNDFNYLDVCLILTLPFRYYARIYQITENEMIDTTIELIFLLFALIEFASITSNNISYS